MQITIYLFYFYHNFPRENRRWWDAAAEADLQSKPVAARPPAQHWCRTIPIYITKRRIATSFDAL